MTYTDRCLTCVEFGAEFTFTAGEQEFHASKGFTNDPTRCHGCRAARRQRRDEGGGGYGGGGGYSERPARTMYNAICATCNQPTQVPFMPRGDRPVYCSSCFSRSDRPERGGGGGDRGGSRGGGQFGGGRRCSY